MTERFTTYRYPVQEMQQAIRQAMATEQMPVTRVGKWGSVIADLPRRTIGWLVAGSTEKESIQ